VASADGMAPDRDEAAGSYQPCAVGPRTPARQARSLPGDQSGAATVISGTVGAGIELPATT